MDRRECKRVDEGKRETGRNEAEGKGLVNGLALDCGLRNVLDATAMNFCGRIITRRMQGIVGRA